MDTSLSDNRSNSNLLTYVASIAAVIALIIAIVALLKLNSAQKQLAALVDVPQKVDDAVNKATTAAADARGAKQDVRTLQTLMERAIEQQLSDIRGNIARVEDMAKQAMERPSATVAASSGGGGGGSGVVTAPPGSLDADGAYVIKSGDTFGKIAPQFGVTPAEIVAANPGVDPRRLRVGQKIIIPRK